MDNNLSNGKKKGGIIAVIILLITGVAGYFGIDLNNSNNSSNSNSTTSVAIEQQATDYNVSNNEDNDVVNSKDTQENVSQADQKDKKDDTKEENSKNDISTVASEEVLTNYTFRTEQNLTQHFEKHGNEFDYKTKEEYVAGANRVISSKDALHKLEKEDGDDVYYLEATNEFVVVSKQGYIRTYFKPDKGIAYYNKQ